MDLGPLRFTGAREAADGDEVDRATALDATYDWARAAAVRALAISAATAALMGLIVGVMAGASPARL